MRFSPGCCCGSCNACAAELSAGPTTLFGTFSNNFGCACLAGVSVSLVYDGLDQRWKYNGSACSHPLVVVFRCDEVGEWRVTVRCGTIGGSQDIDDEQHQPAGSCDPLLVTFVDLQFAGPGACCTGSINLTVTE